ncbi:capsid protein [Staphylococcus saprophyticus]|uniref:phage minor capsid protein n=1 Tax=Staphylococcus saprophyticus TaxID=29385 RepID=UPI0011A00F63|nr:phage minor capsid protein [Staphylococcus saprophyticus]MDW4104111.1 capsid protein [Staphylococcus saprophyticus]MDW4205196.1 capsid protein [Staphylococcus saprophyticus]
MALTPEQVKKISQFLKNQVKELVSGVNIESEKDTQRMYMAIEKLFDDLGSSVQKEVPKTIYEQYAKGLSNAQQQLVDTGLITSAGNFNVQNAIAQQFVHTDAITSIVTDTMQDLASAFRTAKQYSKKNVDVAVKDVQEEIAKGLMVGMTNKQMSQRVAKKFGEQGMTSFVTVDGKHLPLDFYAETVVRTKTQTAYNHSHLNRYIEDDIKHVYVTGNIPTCGECVRYRGHVFATERGDQFPYINLYTTFPKHPNCQCNFRPYIIDFKSDEEIKKDLEHSKTFDESTDNRTQAEKDRYNTDQKAKAKARRNSLSYNKMRNRLGSDGPQTFKEYLQVKTNDKPKYHEWVAQMKKVYDPNKISDETQSAQEEHTSANNVSDTNVQDDNKQAENDTQNATQDNNSFAPIETLDELIDLVPTLSETIDNTFGTNFADAPKNELKFELDDFDKENEIPFNRKSQEVISEMFGYNELPQLITQDEFDKLDESNKLMRGLNDFGDTPASELIEQYKTGEHYIGRGIFGHGTYTAVMTEENKELVLSRYAKDNASNIMNMKVNDDANVISKKDLNKIKKEWEMDIKLSDLDTNTKDLLKGITRNSSNLAVMLGYDVLYIEGQQYYVLLNRGKVSVVND